MANSLALVASLVAMQQRAVAAGADPVAAREALIETQNRITAIAQVHRRLYTSSDVSLVDMDAYLRGLLEELQASMHAAGREHQIVLETEPQIRVPTDKAVSIGVIVTELVTKRLQVRLSLWAERGRHSRHIQARGPDRDPRPV